MAGHDVVQVVCCQYRYELADSLAKGRTAERIAKGSAMALPC